MADDPYKRERSQDGCNKAEKRQRMDFDKAEDSSSRQRQKLSPQRERQSPERGKLSARRGRRSPERNEEAKHRKDTDLPRSSNSLSSDIMKRLQPTGNLIFFPNVHFISQNNAFFRESKKTVNRVPEQQYNEQTSSAAGSRVFKFKLISHRAASTAATSSRVFKFKLFHRAESTAGSSPRVSNFKFFHTAAGTATANF